MWDSDEGGTISYWQSSQDGSKTAELTGPTETEVCVIGGGIAGLTTAYLLSKAGISVIVVDDGPIGGGETARTTAHLSSAIDDRIYRIADWHGDEHARLAVEAHAQAVNDIERLPATRISNVTFQGSTVSSSRRKKARMIWTRKWMRLVNSAYPGLTGLTMLRAMDLAAERSAFKTRDSFTFSSTSVA